MTRRMTIFGAALLGALFAASTSYAAECATGPVTVGGGLPDGRASAIVADRNRPEHIGVVAGGRLWTSGDAGRSWQVRDGGLSEREIDAVALDPSDPDRLWSVAAGQVFRTDDHGRRWRQVGVPLPDQISPRTSSQLADFLDGQPAPRAGWDTGQAAS